MSARLLQGEDQPCRFCTCTGHQGKRVRHLTAKMSSARTNKLTYPFAGLSLTALESGASRPSRCYWWPECSSSRSFMPFHPRHQEFLPFRDADIIRTNTCNIILRRDRRKLLRQFSKKNFMLAYIRVVLRPSCPQCRMSLQRSFCTSSSRIRRA